MDSNFVLMVKDVRNNGLSIPGHTQLCESSKQTSEDEFLQTTARNTIARLKDCREVNVIIYLKFLFVFCFHLFFTFY